MISSQIGNRQAEQSTNSIEELKVKKFNAEIGNLKNFDCPKCKNKGFNGKLDENGLFAVDQCECYKTRNSITKIKKSGLEDLLQEYTFDKYEAKEDWQKDIKSKALAFLDDNYKKWFYIGGQVGSGKTFICTAIADEFLKRGNQVVYMKWQDEIVTLKANKTNYDEYGKIMDGFKNAEVLYIDDLFKVKEGTTLTPADVNTTHELINYRYDKHGLITIISSEYTTKNLLCIDEALGSRVYQRSKDYQVNIAPDIKKNYRLR